MRDESPNACIDPVRNASLVLLHATEHAMLLAMHMSGNMFDAGQWVRACLRVCADERAWAGQGAGAVAERE